MSTHFFYIVYFCIRDAGKITYLCTVENKKIIGDMSYSDKVLQAMLALRDDEQREVLQRFFKTGKGQYGEGDVFLGIKVPQTRAVAKEYWRNCTLGDLEVLIISPYHEVRLVALLILIHQYKHNPADKRFVEFYLGHTEFINNWDLVDLSCYEILGHWLLDKDRTVLYTLARDGKNLWEQRIGMVSCMAFVRRGQLDDCFAIADILLHHPHDLIQKAVGWLLREAGKRDEARLTEFLATRYRTMPRTMLRYAIEKYPENLRQQFLKGLF